MAETIIVAGAGGFGREVLSWAQDAHAAGNGPPVTGFLDDAVDELPGYSVMKRGGFADYTPEPGERVVVAIGEPAQKRKAIAALRARGAIFGSVVHPTCIIARTARVGEGLIMCPYAVIMPDAKVGDFVTLLNFSGVGHDATVGDYTTFSSLVDVTGYCRVGEGVSIGSGGRLLPKVSVGDGATIGAGSVVVRSVKAGTTVFAASAKTLKMSK